MDLKTFTDLTSKMVAYRATLELVQESIPDAIRNEWYAFSTLTRCEHGAQGIEAGTDSARTNTVPFAVQFLAGVVPVDFMFEESREAAKDAYRALCAEIGDPSKAAAQVAEYEMIHAPIQKGIEKDRAEWLRLAVEAGLPVPVIPTEVFASMTRGEFDAAVIVVDAYRETMAAFTSMVDRSVVEAWMAFREGLRAEFGMDALFHVPTQQIDVELFRNERAKAGHSLITTVPLGFLVEETRESFKGEYRGDYMHKAEMLKDEEEHKRLMVEVERKETARREFFDLGKRLGFVNHSNTVII